MQLQEAMIFSGKKIMVVENDTTSRKSIVDLLRNRKALCLEAQNGQEAASLLATNHCDLIITNLRMPVMDGVELIKMVRECEKKSGSTSVPIVVFCAAKSDMFDAAIDSGIDGYVIKQDPFEKSESLPKLILELQRLLAD